MVGARYDKMDPRKAVAKKQWLRSREPGDLTTGEQESFIAEDADGHV